MTPTTLEQLRIRLLMTLNAVAGAELPVSTLVLGSKLSGFSEATEQSVAAELRYLEDKGYVAAAEKTLSPENREWRVTAAGRDFLAQRGL